MQRHVSLPGCPASARAASLAKLDRPRVKSRQRLAEALNEFLRERSRPSYRIVVVDEREKPEGLLTGRRILEALMGLRGLSTVKEEVLGSPVEVFMDELRSILPADAPLEVAVDLLAKSAESLVALVDYHGKMVGVLDPACVLERLAVRGTGVTVWEAARRGAVSIEEAASLREAAETMLVRRVRRLIVTSGEKVVGVIAVRDLVKVLVERAGKSVLDELRVRDVMAKHPLVASPEEPLEAAVERMVVHGVSALPVVDEEWKPLGLLSRIDAVRALVHRMGTKRLSRVLVPTP